MSGCSHAEAPGTLVFTCRGCGQHVICTTAPTREETREAAARGDARAIARMQDSAA